MRGIFKFIAFILISLPATASGEFLLGKELKDRIANGDLAVMTGTDYEFPVAITLKPDGSIEGKSDNGYYDIGRWWLRGDTLCHQWESWFDGLRKCHGVMADGYALTLAKPSAKHFRNAKTRLK